jgi:hypothetical protein
MERAVTLPVRLLHRGYELYFGRDLRCLEKGYGEIQVEEPVHRVLDFVVRHPAGIAKPAQGLVPTSARHVAPRSERLHRLVAAAHLPHQHGREPHRQRVGIVAPSAGHGFRAVAAPSARSARHSRLDCTALPGRLTRRLASSIPPAQRPDVVRRASARPGCCRRRYGLALRIPTAPQRLNSKPRMRVVDTPTDLALRFSPTKSSVLNFYSVAAARPATPVFPRKPTDSGQPSRSAIARTALPVSY